MDFIVDRNTRKSRMDAVLYISDIFIEKERIKAQEGDVFSQLLSGYFSLDNNRRETSLAEKWFEIAAENNSEQAQYLLGYLKERNENYSNKDNPDALIKHPGKGEHDIIDNSLSSVMRLVLTSAQDNYCPAMLYISE